MRSRTSLLAGLAAFFVVLAAFVASGSPAGRVYAQEPPPRPTLTPAPPATPTPPAAPTAQPEQKERDEPTPAPSGRITGTVIDLASGAPVSGAPVRVGDRVAITDGNGNYDLPGLPAGTYVVALVLADGAVPAQAPVTIQLAEGQTVVQHLAFRPAATEAAPAPVSQPGMPTALPATSGERSSALVLRAVIALLLLAGGVVGRIVFRRHTAAE